MEFVRAPRSPSSEHGGCLSIFLNAPDDVFARILHHTIHKGPEFGVQKEEDDDGEPSSNLSPRSFASSILLTCKHFHELGTPVLWANIVLRSPKALRQVVDLSQNGARSSAGALASHTVRLEIRMLGGYDMSSLVALLRLTHRLRVFLLHTYASPIDDTVPCSPDALLQALNSHCQDLTRVQLESPIDAPSPRAIVHLLNLQPWLETLTIMNLSTEPQSPGLPLDSAKSPNPRRALRALTVGFALWDPIRVPPNAPALDELMHALGSEKCLPNLRALELFDSTPSMGTMLVTYGPQLRGLLKVASRLHDARQIGPTVLDMCPNLTHLAWIIVNWSFVNPSRSFPIAHRNLKILVLGLCQPPNEDPALFTPHLQQLLYAAYVGDYPALESISVCPRGSRLPPIHDSDWFRHLALRWAECGVKLLFVPPE